MMKMDVLKQSIHLIIRPSPPLVFNSSKPASLDLTGNLMDSKTIFMNLNSCQTNQSWNLLSGFVIFFQCPPLLYILLTILPTILLLAINCISSFWWNIHVRKLGISVSYQWIFGTIYVNKFYHFPLNIFILAIHLVSTYKTVTELCPAPLREHKFHLQLRIFSTAVLCSTYFSLLWEN